MKTLIMEGVVRAKTQISHNGGEINGNIAAFRRMKVIQDDGRTVEVPVVSGNSVRGGLRDIGAKKMLDLLGEDNKPHAVGIDLFQLLFSGGNLTDKKIDGDIDYFKKMRHNMPHIGLFGGAWGNSILAGKMKINPLIPIAKETSHILPKAYQGFDLPSCYAYLQMEMYTRKENSGDAQFEKYLESEENQDISTTQMIYHVETLSAGTPLYWKVILEDVTPVEYDFFLSVLESWKNICVVGGKSSVGFGQLEIAELNWREITKDGNTLTIGEHDTESLYSKFIEDNAGGIRAYMKTLV